HSGRPDLPSFPTRRSSDLVLERNIARQSERAREAGVRLRPHAKTHKCPEIARMQLAAGAAGISLAKTSEAEVFAAAGFADIFLRSEEHTSELQSRGHLVCR